MPAHAVILYLTHFDARRNKRLESNLVGPRLTSISGFASSCCDFAAAAFAKSMGGSQPIVALSEAHCVQFCLKLLMSTAEPSVYLPDSNYPAVYSVPADLPQQALRRNSREPCFHTQTSQRVAGLRAEHCSIMRLFAPRLGARKE